MMKSSGSRRKRAGAIIAALIALAVAAGLLWRGGDVPEAPEEAVEPRFEGVALLESDSPSLEARTAPAPRPARLPPGGELMPEEVIDHPDCGLQLGSGAARGLAMVVVGGDNGARFSVLDETGALHAGELPFLPNHYYLGKREDGSILAGFGDLRLNSLVFREKDTPEPVQIHLDGQLIDERDKVWEFGIASDGSSYWLIEPLGGRNSRLVVRNLDEGTERHHDLGGIYASNGYERPYGASYTPGYKELHVQPSDFNNLGSGKGLHYFFPITGGGKVRKVRIEETGPFDQTMLVSSEEGYFFFAGEEDGPGLQVSKRRFNWATGEAEAVWETTGSNRVGPGVLTQSTWDGAWLLFDTDPLPFAFRSRQSSDWVMYVLDASTGEAAFMFPTVDKKAQLSQLASVLGPEAAEEDVGAFTDAYIDTDYNQLLIGRRFKKDGRIDRSRGVFDVYDLSTITLRGQPDSRVAINHSSDNHCASKMFSGQLLAQEDGRLAYAAREPVASSK